MFPFPKKFLVELKICRKKTVKTEKKAVQLQWFICVTSTKLTLSRKKMSNRRMPFKFKAIEQSCEIALFMHAF